MIGLALVVAVYVFFHYRWLKQFQETEFKYILELEYRLDRSEMNRKASAHLAEYRMYRILELESKLP